jgi:hypothetical protein
MGLKRKASHSWQTSTELVKVSRGEGREAKTQSLAREISSVGVSGALCQRFAIMGVRGEKYDKCFFAVWAHPSDSQSLNLLLPLPDS